MSEPTITSIHRVECHALKHSKLISNLLPEQSYSVYCQRCKMVHDVLWSDLPTDVLRRMLCGISVALSERDEPTRQETEGARDIIGSI